VRKFPSKQVQPDDVSYEQAPHTNRGIPRRVCVKGMQGIDVTVVVTVVQGKVWLSVSPPFTWEAIMEPGKVDEVIHVLRLAREEVEKLPAARGRPAADGGKAVVGRLQAGRSPGPPLDGREP
jgi:hypothetical protein